MKILKTLCVAALSVFAFNVHSQTYDFSVSTGIYTDLTDTTSVNKGMTWDDPTFEIPIGFDFKLFDTTITKIVTYDAAGVICVDTFESRIVPFLIITAHDLIDRGYDLDEGEVTQTSLSPISYKLSGSDGNRVLKVEWKNAGFYGEFEEDEISEDYTNFQLWLYEGSNDIEIHYGPNSIQPELSYYGLSGDLIGFFPSIRRDSVNEFESLEEGIVLSGDPQSPEVFNYKDMGDDDALDGTIPNGTIYKFAYRVSGVQSLESSGLSIYPNPVEDVLSFEVKDGEWKNYTFSIVDLLGNTIKELPKSNRVDVKDLNSGVYFLMMQSAEGYSMHKFIKK